MISAQRVSSDHAAEAAYNLALEIRRCLKQDIISKDQFQAAIQRFQSLYQPTASAVWEEEFDITPKEFILWKKGRWPDFANHIDVVHNRLLREKARGENLRAIRRRLNIMTRVLCRDFRFQLEE
jgi:hypothetical protein